LTVFRGSMGKGTAEGRGSRVERRGRVAGRGSRVTDAVSHARLGARRNVNKLCPQGSGDFVERGGQSESRSRTHSGLATNCRGRKGDSGGREARGSVESQTNLTG
jgi:hypothetical protein